MDLIFASDFFIEDFVGGAALNDEELIICLQKLGHKVDKIRTDHITKEYVIANASKIWLISNFFKLSEECKGVIAEKVSYSIISHDYKFVKHTNPAIYKDFLVPHNELINVSFLNNAKNVFCQSNLQKRIHDANLKEAKTENLSGNLWSDKAIEFMAALSKRSKLQSFAVVKSPYPQKGVPESIALLIQNKIDYELVSDQDYFAFLNKMAMHSGLCFIARTPETLSRVVCEAKACGMAIISNNLVGATGEPWYQEKDFIKVMREMKERIPKLIEGKL